MILRCDDCGGMEFIAAYQEGVMAVGCDRCQKTIAQVSVARRPPGFVDPGGRKITWNWFPSA